MGKLVKLKLPINKLFEKLNINHIEDDYFNEKGLTHKVPCDIYIKNENNELSKINFLVTKKDRITSLKLQNGLELKVGSGHTIIENGEAISVKKAKFIDTIDGEQLKILKKTTTNKKEIVYDLSIDAPHIYQIDGTLHHNTTVATIMFLYDIARILCMESPQSKFKLQKSAKLVGVIINSTREAAQTVNFDTMMTLIRKSPFFQSKLNNKSKTSLFIKDVDIVIATRKRNLVGMNAFTGLVDEVARFDSIQKGLAKEMITELINRINSRFMYKDNKWFGVPSIISSADTDGSIIADLYKMAENGELGIPPEQIFMVSPARYEVKKDVFDYSGKTFKIFIGNMMADPFIIEDEKDLEKANIVKTSDDEIREVPIEHLKEFKLDIYSGIRDVMGINISNTRSFITSKDTLRECMNISPICPEVITLQNGGNLLEHFSTKQIDILKRGAQIVIGMDIALSGDRFGLAAGHIHKFDEKQEPIIYIDFATAIQPKEGEKLKLGDIRQFIYDIIDKYGVNVELVLTDTFQSIDTIQILNDRGIKAKQHSVDKTKDPYHEFQSMIYEKRVFLPHNKLLFKELSNLKEDDKKIDHPEWFPDGTKGSKDIADAVCQVIYGLLHEVEYDERTSEDFLDEFANAVGSNDKVSLFDKEFLEKAKAVQIDYLN